MAKLKLNQPRRIICAGRSSLVTLPKPWLKNHGLLKGDLVDFEIDENLDLILKPKKVVEKNG